LRLLRRVFAGGFLFGVFYFAVSCCEPIADFLWIIFEWAHAPAIGDESGFIHDVKTFRPRGIEVIDCIGHVINAKGKRIVVSLGKIVGDGQALLHRLGLDVANIFLDVRLHLPFVGGMRFADIDGQKIGMGFVVVEDLYDVTDLATERRSSKAAEDEDKWLAVDVLANQKMIGAI
jgi:hypothetical protein